MCQLTASTLSSAGHRPAYVIIFVKVSLQVLMYLNIKIKLCGQYISSEIYFLLWTFAFFHSFIFAIEQTPLWAVKLFKYLFTR